MSVRKRALSLLAAALALGAILSGCQYGTEGQTPARQEAPRDGGEGGGGGY